MKKLRFFSKRERIKKRNSILSHYSSGVKKEGISCDTPCDTPCSTPCDTPCSW